MKILSLCLLFLLLFLYACYVAAPDEKKTKKSEADVPPNVIAAFEAKYPEEKSPKWGIDRNGNWEANFKIDGKNYNADFTPEGTWIESETSLKQEDLPAAVQKAIEEQFGDHKIVEIEKTEHNSKGIFYDVEFKKNGQKFDIEFSEEGRITGRE